MAFGYVGVMSGGYGAACFFPRRDLKAAVARDRDPDLSVRSLPRGAASPPGRRLVDLNRSARIWARWDGCGRLAPPCASICSISSCRRR